MPATRAAAILLLMAAALPMRLPAQCPNGTPPPCAGTAPPVHSVAVLTFGNITGDSASQYLAEGLADQIFTRLAQVERLSVTSRSAVRRLRNADHLSTQDLGRALRAAYLVNGTINSAGGRLRIHVEALRASSGTAIWSQAFDRAPGDVLGLEEAIATEVAAGITGRLTPGEQRGLARHVTTNTAAYARLLRGNVMLARRTPASLVAAAADFAAAAEIDPAMAEAHARLAYTYALCGLQSCGLDTTLARSRAAAVRAVTVDPRSSDAWMARGYELFLEYRSIAGPSADSLSTAYAAFRRAVTLDPRNAEAWHQFGASLTGVSDSGAEDALRHALAIDPTRAISYLDLANVYATTGRTALALKMLDSAIALDSGNGIYFASKVTAQLEAGDTAGALVTIHGRDLGGLEEVLRASFGRDSTARRAIEDRIAQGRAGEVFFLPEYYQWTGRIDAAVRVQMQRIATRSFPWFWLRRPLYDGMRSDPRIAGYLSGVQREVAAVRWH